MKNQVTSIVPTAYLKILSIPKKIVNLSVKQKEKWGRLAGEEWVTLFKEQDGGVKRASFTVR